MSVSGWMTCPWGEASWLQNTSEASYYVGIAAVSQSDGKLGSSTPSGPVQEAVFPNWMLSKSRSEITQASEKLTHRDPG